LPFKIADAIRYLVNTKLYRKHSVSVNEQWISDFTSETVPFIASQEDLSLVEEQLQIQQEDVNTEGTNADKNTEAEELNPGGQETMLENNQTLHVRAKDLST